METIRSVNPNPNAGAAVVANSPAPNRTAALPPTQRVNQSNAPVAVGAAPSPLHRGLAAWDNRMQNEVARAQQALDYLDRLQNQLEMVKSDLAARLSGSRGGARQLEARIRQLGATLDGRRKSAGDGVSNQLEFTSSTPAPQRFRMRGLDIGALRGAGPQTLTFTIGGGPQLSVNIDPNMSAEEIMQQFGRTLAPANIGTSLDGEGQLVFTTSEANLTQIRDSITLVGRGRVAIEEEPANFSARGLETSDVESLRESLREVVQTLARVHRSREAASAALSAAMARAATAQVPPPAEVQLMAESFVSTAGSPDYDSLIAITSALVGVSRERVLALLGLR
jgi:hypothetical protein